jgi:DNA-nicking Smr family endonuclease
MTKKTKPSGKTKAEGSKKVADPAFRPFGALKALRDEMHAKEGKSGTAASAEAPRPARSTSKKHQPTAVSSEDEALALFRLMNGVTPLAGKAPTRLPRSQVAVDKSDLDARRAEAEAPIRAEEEAVHAHLRALVEGGRFEVQDDGRRVEGRRAGVSPDTLRKLRRGLMPIDARLDLHGETATSAPKTLEQFLRAQRTRGERCVLVVHGKGDHSPAHQGILRGEMSAWLSQGAASAHVSAFATAAPDDGGEGAVYILLER